MITIAQFSKPEEAYLLRARLESGGVAAYVLDENIVQMDWLLSNAVGGVRVAVAEEDADQAEAILWEEPEGTPSERPECPHCHSTDTNPDETPRRVNYLLILLFHFLLLNPRHRWKCSACGHAWKAREAVAA